MCAIGFKQFKMENRRYPNKWVTPALTVSLIFLLNFWETLPWNFKGKPSIVHQLHKVKGTF